MKTIECGICEKTLIPVVNSQDLESVTGWYCAVCGTFQWDCPKCAEPMTSENAMDFGSTCGGDGYCKHTADDDLLLEQITANDLYRRDSERLWQDKEYLQEEYNQYPETRDR